MAFLEHLWLPILLSAAAVWIASAVIWMFLPHHKDDFDKLPDEEGFIGSLRNFSLAPGNYGFPYCGDKSKMNDPEFKKKWEEGPLGLLNVWPKPNMARNMVLTFLVYLVVSSLIAY